MKKMYAQLLGGFILGWLSSLAVAAPSITGYWKTIDDVTGQPKAIIHITQAPDATFSGKIIKIYPRPGHDQHEVCSACQGSKRNQPIVGMTILEKLQPLKDKPNQWTEGQILDPLNGKVYHCNAQLLDNGIRLSVRGYVGVPLFGRSQTWLRVSL